MIQIFTVFLLTVGYAGRLFFNLEETAMSRLTGDSRQEIIQLQKQGLDNIQIGDMLGVNHNIVTYHLRNAGIWQRKRLNDREIAEVVSDYQSGKSSCQLATSLGCSSGAVCNVLKRNGISIRDGSESKRKYTLRKSAFADAEHDSQAGYWTGFLMADGSVRTGRQVCVDLRLSNKDYNHVEKFQRFLGTDMPISIQTRDQLLPTGNVLLNYRSAGLVITSKEIVHDLMRYGVCPRKSLTAQVKLLEMNRHFWRGVIDGDGTVNFVLFNGKYRIPHLSLVGSQKLIDQFIEFVKVSINYQLKSHQRGKIYCVSTVGRFAVRIIKKIYEGDVVALNRKYKTAQQAVKWESRRPDQSMWTLEELEELHRDYGTWKLAAKDLGMKEGTLIMLHRRRKQQRSRQIETYQRP